MEEDRVEIPDFMKTYYEGTDYEGQAYLENLAQRYNHDRQERMAIHNMQQFMYDTMPGNIKKNIDPEPGISPVKENYRKQAYNLAKEHGYTGPEFIAEERQQNANSQHKDNDQEQADAYDDTISERQEFLSRLMESRKQKTEQQYKPRL